MIVDQSVDEATREKRNVALGSALAALLLTGMKLAVGLLTGSLGLLAEAAHSTIDMLASLITLSAVHIADRPADETHPYGHGKVENLSALIEVGLLLLTSVWIIYESIQRLFFRASHVEATIWAFGVMATSIVVDFIRSRVLLRTAKRLKSQALEADALNFRMDMLSSTVVIIGLAMVRLSDVTGGNEWLTKGDAVAALGVAGLTAWVSLRMALRATDVLLDRAPVGLARDLRVTAQTVPGVLTCSPVRTRQVGPRVFVDLTIAVSRNASFQEAHAIASSVEEKLRELVPTADVVVHVDPASDPTATLVHDIQALAQRQRVSTHHVTVHQVGEDLNASLHLEVGRELTLSQAHEIASQLEAAIHDELPQLTNVSTHIEPAISQVERGVDVTEQEPGLVAAIERLIADIPGVAGIQDVKIQQGDFGLAVSLRCCFAGSESVEDVHVMMSKLERLLRRKVPNLDQVFIDPEIYPDGESKEKP